MKINLNKKALYLLTGPIMLISGCSNMETINTINIPALECETLELEEIPDKKEEPTINEDIVKDGWIHATYNCYVRATTNTNIYSEASNDSEIIGNIKRNDYLTRLDLYDQEFNQVVFNDQIGYIKRCESEIVVKHEFKRPFIKVVKLDEYTTLYYDDNMDIELCCYPEFEIAEVYQEKDDIYLVRTNDGVGFVYKDNCTDILDNTFVVVDISDQELKLYNDNNVIIDTPVVTGGPNSPTNVGDFNVWDASYNRYLTGPGYSSYVNVMLAFDNGIGLHDAEYYTEDNGFSHGWRNYSEFGNQTYLTHGSHGCVNLPHDEAIEISNYVEVGTRVLVKQ